VLIAGEPGIGKTAVLGALAREAGERGVPVVWGHCWDGDGVPAFWPWVQVVRALSAASGVDAAEARHLLPESDAGARDEVGPAATARFRLFDAIVRLLVDVAKGDGLVVVLDDLQWADDASVLLLEFASRHVRHAGVLVVGAYRDVEAGSALERLAGVGEVVPLAGLAPSESRALVGDVCGSELPDDVAADVARRAGGNPLFVRELTRLVLTQHRSGTGDGARVLGSVREVVQRRLNRLSSPCREMIDLAAVLGPEVRVEVLSRVLHGRSDLADRLGEAVRARVLLPPPEALGPYTFAHDLFREVVIEALPRAARARLHIAVAVALDALEGEGMTVAAATVAAHYVAAASCGLPEAALPAVHHSLAAASDAERCLAFEDAVTHLERALAALELAPAPDLSTRVDLLLALGTARDHAGSAATARDAFSSAALIARRAGDSTALARAAIGIHRLGALSGLPRTQTVRLLEDAAQALAGERSALRARVLSSLARELHHTWDDESHQRAEAIADEALTLARALEDHATHAFCLLARHDVEWAPGSAPRRLPLALEMLELARRAGDDDAAAEAQLLKATALLEMGDPTARNELERYCRAADALGHARGHWRALSRRATGALIDGDLDRAAALGAEAARLGEEIGEPDWPGVWDTLRWELGRFGGDRSEMEPADHWVPDGTWPPMRALLCAARGDAAGAEATLSGFSPLRDRRYALRHDGWTQAATADAVALAGNQDQRDEAYAALLPLAGTHLVYGGAMGYGGAVDHYLGVLAVASGRHDDAVTHLEAAVTMHDAIGARAWSELDRSLLAAQHAKPPHDAQPDVNRLRREGDIWTVTYRGRAWRVRHVKGLLDLAVLLARPGREILALELMGGAEVGGVAGPTLDDRARRQYQVRISELQREIDAAQDANDRLRAEGAEHELDALVEQITQAFGLGGRARTTGSATERARAAVTHRIRGAISRLGELDPDLARHLANTVKTGTWCAYLPESDAAWDVDVDLGA
jgi:tetratricopeptide (TPR) repeat protein